MSGRGKGIKGLGSGGAMRHKKVLRNNIEGITKGAMNRIARRSGVKRISGAVYNETRSALTEFLSGVEKDAATYMEHSRRKTLSTKDVLQAFKRKNQALYGFDDK